MMLYELEIPARIHFTVVLNKNNEMCMNFTIIFQPTMITREQ